MDTSTLNNKQLIFNSLKEFTPFNCLDDKTIRDIAYKAAVKQYPQGSFVFREGELSKKTLFVVLEGQATAVARRGNREAVTTKRNRGDYFGVTALLSDDYYPVSVRAAQDLTCLLISFDSFLKTMNSSKPFSDYFTRELAVRIKELYLAFASDSADQQLPYEHTLRRRVSDYISGEVTTCRLNDPVNTVARLMNGGKVSSVVVVDNGKPVGIITEKDLVSKVLAAERPNLQLTAEQVMTTPLITVHPDDFSFQALLMMFKHSIKHIVVTDSANNLQGIVTVKDLIRTGNTGTLTIINQIEYQDSITGLAKLMGEVDMVQQALLSERSYASEICALVNELYDRLTRRIIKLCEEQLLSEGWGAPPGKYCFINMGSAGRKEQFSRTDQDNGIIYSDTDKTQADDTAAYFLALGKLIVKGLEECGFTRCRGEVMADNPHWCLPLSAWKNRTSQWVNQLDPKDIRNMTIFLDYRFIAGVDSLFNSLKDHTTALFQNAGHALLFMAEDDLRQRIPLNIFNQVVTERSGEHRNKLNIKSGALVHMVDCLRLFALREGIRETNTFERIRKLKEITVFNADDADSFDNAYETLLMFRIRETVKQIRQGSCLNHYINPYKLNRKEKSLLKESLMVTNRLQTLTIHAFHAHNA